MVRIRRLEAWSALVSFLWRPVPLATPDRTFHPLILVRTLLVAELPPRLAVTISLDPVAPTTAAATAEHPEEASAQRERHREPDVDVDAAAQIAMDVVFLQRAVEGAGEGGVEDCGREGEGDDEEGADGADDRGGEAAPAGEKREETDEDLDDGGDEGDDVGDEHPFRDGLVGVQSVAKLFAKELVDTRVVETPDLYRIEPERVLMW